MTMNKYTEASGEKHEQEQNKGSPSQVRLKRRSPREFFVSVDSLLLATVVESEVYSSTDYPVKES